MQNPPKRVIHVIQKRDIQTGWDYTGPRPKAANVVTYWYEVRRLKNCTQPRIGDRLTEDEVQHLIVDGATVEVAPAT